MRKFWTLGLWVVPAMCLYGALEIPGDARRGEELFKTQKCVQCHGINGQGGTAGPDLGRRIGRNYTPALMASLMWNHAPAMWSAMAKAGVARPQLDTAQVADLFAYFYAARYFEQPGDAGRGKQVFESKRCATCHKLSGAAGPSGAKPVSEWTSLKDPILLAQEMWNHAAQMKAATGERSVPWPVLTGQQLTDLVIYLQNIPGIATRAAEFSAASAQTGKMLFELKGCAKCHVGDMSLENRFANRTLTDFAASMWNHSAKMVAAGQRQPLRSEEMRRLVGYLWSVQVFDEKGDAQRGAKVFERGNCGACHGVAASGAPALGGTQRTSLSMVSVLWKHGPAMLQQMQAKKIAWLRFAGPDMPDLIAYLNSK